MNRRELISPTKSNCIWSVIRKSLWKYIREAYKKQQKLYTKANLLQCSVYYCNGSMYKRFESQLGCVEEKLYWLYRISVRSWCPPSYIDVCLVSQQYN